MMDDPANRELVTTSRLVGELRALGVDAGTTLLVHSSLSSLGWVCGGPQAVIEALQTAVGDEGTLVMPTHSAQLTDPSGWQSPPVPEEWWETIREELPAYDRSRTQTRNVGVIPEMFRKADGVRRSGHPTLSFASWGADRDRIVEGHTLEEGLGRDSPLERLYELGGQVLLLGVGHEANTSIHLAEYRWSGAAERRGTVSTAIRVDGRRRWVDYEDIAYDDSDFPAIGEAFEQSVGLTSGRVGEAEARLLSQPELVDFAVDWMEANRE